MSIEEEAIDKKILEYIRGKMATYGHAMSIYKGYGKHLELITDKLPTVFIRPDNEGNILIVDLIENVEHKFSLSDPGFLDKITRQMASMIEMRGNEGK